MAARESQHERRETILLVLGCFVVVAEVVGVLIQQAFPGHPVPTEFHAIAFLVATALFGGAAYNAKKQERNGA